MPRNNCWRMALGSRDGSPIGVAANYNTPVRHSIRGLDAGLDSGYDVRTIRREPRPRQDDDHSGHARPLLAAIAGTFVVTLALPYIGPIAALFAFTPLPAGELAIIIAMTALYLVVLDVVKEWYFQAFPHPAPAQVETATRPPLVSGAGVTSANGFGRLLMRVRAEPTGR
jgi:hypothetical protein